MERARSVVLRRPGQLTVESIEIPRIPSESIQVEMRACGICGSDVRYFQGENPWALHTLGRNVPSPPNMVLGHEVTGVTIGEERPRRVAILAYRACGVCRYCNSGRENLCPDMEHFGHAAGWQRMEYYPGGMAERFNIWTDFACEIPDSIGFEEATFLDGLAVAIHSMKRGGLRPGSRCAVVGLGPIGLLAAQVAREGGASIVAGCDTSELPVELAHRVGIVDAFPGDSHVLAEALRAAGEPGYDLIVDTVGTPESIWRGLRLLDGSGRLVLLAVHSESVPLRTTLLSGERSVTTSANNTYAEFREAIDLLGSGRVRVRELITHRFPLEAAPEAFDVMLHKDERQAYKVVITH